MVYKLSDRAPLNPWWTIWKVSKAASKGDSVEWLLSQQQCPKCFDYPFCGKMKESWKFAPKRRLGEVSVFEAGGSKMLQLALRSRHRIGVYRVID